jgi:hypothetical protein
MHAYVYEAGEDELPGHISSETWIPDAEWTRVEEEGLDRRTASDRLVVPGAATVLTRVELLADIGTREALLAWEAHDDSAAEVALELGELRSV